MKSFARNSSHLKFYFSAKSKNYCSPKVCNKCRSFLVRNYGGGKSKIILSQFFRAFFIKTFRQARSLVVDVFGTCTNWRMLFSCLQFKPFSGKIIKIFTSRWIFISLFSCRIYHATLKKYFRYHKSIWRLLAPINHKTIPY